MSPEALRGWTCSWKTWAWRSQGDFPKRNSWGVQKMCFFFLRRPWVQNVESLISGWVFILHCAKLVFWWWFCALLWRDVLICQPLRGSTSFLDFAYFVELLLELLSGLPSYAPSSFASGGSGWQILLIYFDFWLKKDAPAWSWKKIWSTQSIWKSGYYLWLHVTSQGMRIQRSPNH